MVKNPFCEPRFSPRISKGNQITSNQIPKFSLTWGSENNDHYLDKTRVKLFRIYCTKHQESEKLIPSLLAAAINK